MMEPQPGDELVVEADQDGRGRRVGTILSVQGRNAYLVHWVAGDYDALVHAWPGVHVRHAEHRVTLKPAVTGQP